MNIFCCCCGVEVIRDKEKADDKIILTNKKTRLREIDAEDDAYMKSHRTMETSSEDKVCWLRKLPVDVQHVVFNVDKEIFLKWPVLCSETAQSSRFINSFDTYEKFGLWKRFKGDLLIESQWFNGNRKEGERREWDENGCLKVIENYVGNKREGIQKKYHENGQMETHCSFKKGKMHGSFKQWSEGGQLLCQCSYNGGLRDGEYTEWYDAHITKAPEKPSLSSSSIDDSISVSVFSDEESFATIMTESAYPMQIKKRVFYVYGMKEGEGEYFLPNGELEKRVMYKHNDVVM
mmetsp:Transcript_28604/g.31774  ORF Transcript_28604/g.31774 Transcript_28604/m.31774 type:complete len:291 (+) Transcript_28604:102-974(+)